ncbi:hypothetical protein [Micromonospora globispora]|uniref:hypothetical protein n=1 Tax=Micromonospora globispora TaxID=1450148 RepID=UPI000F5EC678|nr:hypothetical protein [Micromonospora globispora]
MRASGVPPVGRAVPELRDLPKSLTGALYLDKAEELHASGTVWKVWDALALGEAESRDMIKRIIGEMRHD